MGYPASTNSQIKNWIAGGNSLIYKNEVLADSPWAYWRLGETSGTTATDSSGNGRNATYNNSPTLGANPLISVDKAVDLDGTNDYINYLQSSAITGNFTIECWINADSVSGFPGIISAWLSNTSGNYGATILINGGIIEIYAPNSSFTGWSYTDNTSYSISTGVTYHLVWVNDDTNNTAYLYVNGELQYTATGKTTAMGLVNANKNIDIGRATASNYFNGKIDEVAIYTTTLSASRIATHYNAGVNGVNPIFPSLGVEYLVVAGGGGGGSDSGGGGGAGGYLTNTTSVFTQTDYTVTIGSGGAGGNYPTDGANGTDSVFSAITATGGGKGQTETKTVGNGGSGGGGAAGPGSQAGGTGTSGQGNNGGNGSGVNPSSYGDGGGGGGAGAAGSSPVSGNGGAGGNGLASSITGSSVTRAGGGGGGTLNTGTGGTAGTGGGGTGGGSSNVAGGAGTVNTGGGGGGASNDTGGAHETGGNGGSGIVILSYPSTYTITVGSGLTHSTSTVGSNKVTSFTAGSGNVSWS